MDLGAEGVENPDRFRDRADVSVTVGERFSLGKVSLSRCRIGYLTMHDTDLRAGKNVSLLSLERQTRLTKTALMK